MATAYAMVGKRDGNGQRETARVQNYISVAKTVIGNDGVSFDMWRAITDRTNFDDKELRVLLALWPLLGDRNGREQHALRRVSLKRLAASLGCTDKTAKTRLEGLAERRIIHFRRVGRDDANTTHEVGWNLNFGDWRNIAWQGPEGAQNSDTFGNWKAEIPIVSEYTA
jgi:hypothetical protein